MTNERKLRDFYFLGPQVKAGGYSEIRLAENPATEKVYVCKTVKKLDDILESSTCNQQNSERFRNAEIKGMRLVGSHPHVLDLVDSFEDDSHLHLIMNLCSHGDVLDYISSRTKLEEKEALYIVKQVASALKYCHKKGLVHRDVKPENMFISGWKTASDGGQFPEVKLADFGSCVILKRLEQVCQAAGTLDYTAPEVVLGHYYSKEVDMWSLGVSLYAMLSGTLPFFGETIEETMLKVTDTEPVVRYNQFWARFSIETVDLLDWLLCRDPKSRATASDVLDHPSIQNLDQAPSPTAHCESSPVSPLQFVDESKTLHIPLTCSSTALPHQEHHKVLRSNSE